MTGQVFPKRSGHLQIQVKICSPEQLQFQQLPVIKYFKSPPVHILNMGPAPFQIISLISQPKILFMYLMHVLGLSVLAEQDTN